VASSIRKLSAEIHAHFVACDIATLNGRSLLERPFVERRATLEAMFRPLRQHPTFLLSKATRSSVTARTWLSLIGRGLDGIVAKGLDLPYRRGERSGRYLLSNRNQGRSAYMMRLASCIYIGAAGSARQAAASLLIYFRRCWAVPVSPVARRVAWAAGRDGSARGAVTAKALVEVEGDHIENGRFRHADKACPLPDGPQVGG
jgi:hypothetical protein